jgi:hypothetical protein
MIGDNNCGTQAKVTYIRGEPARLATEGRVTIHLTEDEACRVRALVGHTSIGEEGTRALFSALRDAGIPRRYRVVYGADSGSSLNFEVR